MADKPDASPPIPLAEQLAARRQQISYILFGVGGVLLVVGIALLLSSRFRESLDIPGLRDIRVIWVFTAATAVLLAGVGAQLLSGVGELSEGELVRLLLLGLGGIVGILATFTGFYLTWNVYSANYGDLDTLRKAPAAVAWPGGLILGGLTVLFVSLQIARGSERTSGVLRRLLFGYNAILGCVFLGAILLLLNVLTYLPVGPFKVFERNYDWTQAGMHTLHPTLRNYVATVEEPVTVYLIAGSSDHPITEHLQSMMDQVRIANPRFRTVFLSPARDRERFLELRAKYAFFETIGMLVVYGPEDKPQSRFVPFEELFDTPAPSRAEGTSEEAQRYEFKGQNALYKSLVELTEGQKVIVYFTQGHGEPELDRDFRELRQRLENFNHEVRPLKLEPRDEAKPDDLRVPEDADVVVLARPTVSLNSVDPQLLPALRAYVRGEDGKKGKLVILTDVPEPGPEAETGVEALAAEFNVRINNNRVLGLLAQSPMLVAATTSEALAHPREHGQMASPNPVALAFNPNPDGERATRFAFYNTRTVEPAGRQGSSVAQTLLTTDPRIKQFWTEEDLSRNPLAVVLSLLRDPARRESTVSQVPLPLAVVVSEPSSAMANIPGHGAVGGTPQMVVFGDTTWLRNDQMQEKNADLFISCLAWLRGRKAVGESIDSSVRQRYELGLPESSYSRMYYLPPVLMMLGIVVLGGGVWIVRRR